MAGKSVGVCGMAGAGTVTAVGAGVASVAVNDSVLVINSGVWTDEVVVAASGVGNVGKMTAEEAAALPNFLAAWAILNNYVALKAGDVVVQSNGSGAVGSAITQLGKVMGLKVTSLSGADTADANLASKLAAAGSIKLAVSGQSGKHLHAMMKSLINGAALVTYNGVYEPLSSSTEVQLPVSAMVFNNVSVNGFDLNAWVGCADSSFPTAVAAVTGLAAEKKITLKSTVFLMADVQKAIAEVAKGTTAVLKH
jgi:NADPH:quinone reductase-like Zn-dependent oxidoreductase